MSGASGAHDGLLRTGWVHDIALSVTGTRHATCSGMGSMNTHTGTTTTPGTNGPLEGIKQSVKDFVDQGQEKVEAIKSRVSDVKGRTTTYIKANPLTAVGIAFGLGYLGMRLFRR